MFASRFLLFLFPVHSCPLLLLFHAILICLGYLGGGGASINTSDRLRISKPSSPVLDTAHNPEEALGELGLLIVSEGSIACGKMTHWCDFTIALILNFFQGEHNLVLTKISSQGWACLWLSDVSHSLCRKLTFLHQSSWSWQETSLERCWYLGDLFFFFSGCPQKTNSEISFFFFPLCGVCWNSLSFLHLELFIVVLSTGVCWGPWQGDCGPKGRVK